jgi:cell wall-associated NlpC family hydrolase
MLNAPGVHFNGRVVRAGEALPVGAHLLSPRRGYTHHGIYVGDGKVVHYAGMHRRALSRGPVEEISLEEFGDGQVVLVRIDAAVHFPASVIVERARSRLGENRYRITTNNCEHFCEWCLRGESRSEQVERWLAWPRRTAAGVLARASRLLGVRVRAGAGAV